MYWVTQMELLFFYIEGCETVNVMSFGSSEVFKNVKLYGFFDVISMGQDYGIVLLPTVRASVGASFGDCEVFKDVNVDGKLDEKYLGGEIRLYPVVKLWRVYQSFVNK